MISIDLIKMNTTCEINCCAAVFVSLLVPRGFLFHLEPETKF